MTFEERLNKQLATPLMTKTGAQAVNEDGTPMYPVDAMVKSVVNGATHGDFQAIAFINNLKKSEDSPEHQRHRKEQEQQLLTNEDQIAAQLKADGIYDPTMQIEIERLANTLLIVQRLETLMREPGHQDVLIEVNRMGMTKATLSKIDELRQKQLEQFNRDLQLLRNTALQRIQTRRRYKK